MIHHPVLDVELSDDLIDRIADAVCERISRLILDIIEEADETGGEAETRYFNLRDFISIGSTGKANVSREHRSWDDIRQIPIGDIIKYQGKADGKYAVLEDASRFPQTKE